MNRPALLLAEVRKRGARIRLANNREVIEQAGFLCPHCRFGILVESERGLDCAQCEKVAWLWDGTSLTRADFADPSFDARPS